MAVEEGGGEGGGEETLPVSSRVKFYCSYGGKILPRPHDGILKYVGGETRVVAVSRKITFSELIEKVSNLFEGYLVLKYQIASEDLDALVSVKCEEDLRHMFEEYDRIESEGNSKLRTFLFPIKPTIIETAQNPFSVVVPQSLEQRFVDALNGVVRTTRPPFSMSRIKSVSSSPSESPSPQSNSPNGAALNPSMNSEASFINSLQTNVNLNLNLTRMHKARSSPSLCSISSHQNYIAQLSNNHRCHYHYYYSHSHQHQHHHYGYQAPCRVQDHQIHPPHSMIQSEFGKVMTSRSRRLQFLTA